MDWFQAVDIYCERTGPAFWAEPVNALSNLSFPAAALWAAIEARRRRITAPILWILIAMAALIGLGSFLFHSFAQVWSSYADTVPIWAFVAVLTGTAMHVIGGARPGPLAIVGLGLAAAIVVLTLAADDGSGGTTAKPDRFNGSLQYAPAVAALLVFAVLTRLRRHPAHGWIAAATVVFLISLGFRTIDLAVCQRFPTGTHFLWHLLNGLMIGLLLQMLLRQLPPGPSGGDPLAHPPRG